MKNICLPLLALVFGSACCAQQQDPNVREVEAALLRNAAENIEMYRKGNAAVVFKSQSPDAVKYAQVRLTQTTHDFLFGAIIFDLVRSKEPYKPDILKKRFSELFNFAVFPFYWKAYEPVQGQTKWRDTMPTFEWCCENGITTKGHPLVWTNPAGVPEWLKGYSVETGEQLLKTRVMNIVGGFKGKIEIWDVVNEPVNTRTWLNTEGSDYMREPIDKIADYVEKAFRWAHEANPDAHLILNEFNVIWQSDFNTDPNKTARQAFIQLVTELKKRDTPLSGLGIQAHEPRECWFPPAETVETLDELGALGYPLHITEFIPQSGGKDITGGWRNGKWNLDTQAEFAEQFYRLAFGHPAVISINWWGVHDKRIWLEGGGLLDDQLNPKPIYNILKRMIHDDWKTNLAAKTDADGTLSSFRGFYGKYNVELKTADGKTHNFTLHLSRDGEKEFTFELD